MSRTSCEKGISVFLLTIWILSWGWSSFVGGVFFPYVFKIPFDLILCSSPISVQDAIFCWLKALVLWLKLPTGENKIHRKLTQHCSVPGRMRKTKRWICNTCIYLCVFALRLLLSNCHLRNSFRTHSLLQCHHEFTDPGRNGEWSTSTASTPSVLSFWGT